MNNIPEVIEMLCAVTVFAFMLDFAFTEVDARMKLDGLIVAIASMIHFITVQLS